MFAVESNQITSWEKEHTYAIDKEVTATGGKQF